ncbi:MAG: NAD(P)H-dependent oxidoreductase subunit E [Mycobacteriales bacterium]
MDLRLMEAEPSAAERAAVDAVVGPPTDTDQRRARPDGPRVRALRPMLLPALHGVQDEMGWISPGALNHICQRLGVPPAEAYGVATFYAMFSLQPRAPRVAHVCDDIACALAGGDAIARELAATLGPEGSGTAISWVRSPCLGLCDRAPAVMFQLAGAEDFSLAPATAERVRAGLAGPSGPSGPGGGRALAAPSPGSSTPQTADPRSAGLRLLRRVGLVNPDSLDSYRAHGGYAALRRAVGLGPARVIAEVTDSKLTGRGGAAFPTGLKWDGVAKAPVRPHYLICNADESEPGTFKDRVLMEDDPFALLEAMTIAGYATGCERGYLYIRGEYPLATRRLQNAIAQAGHRGLLGADVMGEGFAFDIELRRGAGAYICGEETALMNSLEGYRGEPRNKPPFPSQVGLFGKPTVINNVETLYNVLDILADGGPAFAGVGSGHSTGTKIFCLSGAVARPGVYEVPFGATLRELLELAGGTTGELRAVLLGGAAGSFVLPDQLDVPLTLAGTREIGASIGSGVIMAFDSSADLTGTLGRIAAFFRDESCGQCVPCRVGTVRQEEALARLSRGAEIGSRQQELALLDDLASVMRDSSICGLGHTAPSAVQSAIALNLLAGDERVHR